MFAPGIADTSSRLSLKRTMEQFGEADMAHCQAGVGSQLSWQLSWTDRKALKERKALEESGQNPSIPILGIHHP